MRNDDQYVTPVQHNAFSATATTVGSTAAGGLKGSWHAMGSWLKWGLIIGAAVGFGMATGLLPLAFHAIGSMLGAQVAVAGAVPGVAATSGIGAIVGNTLLGTAIGGGVATLFLGFPAVFGGLFGAGKGVAKGLDRVQSEQQAAYQMQAQLAAGQGAGQGVGQQTNIYAANDPAPQVTAPKGSQFNQADSAVQGGVSYDGTLASRSLAQGMA